MSSITTKEFQALCRKFFNKKINEYFQDVSLDDWATDKLNERKVVKRLCLHSSSDTLVLTIARMLLLKLFVEGILDQAVIGFPQSELERLTKHSSQIIVHFKESKVDAFDNDRMPVWKQVAFRYRDTPTTEANLVTIANKVKAIFTTGSKFSWKTGKELYTYKDLDKGYNFQIYAFSEAEAKEVIRAIWEIQDGGTPNWEDYLVSHTSDKNYNPTGSQLILGKSVKKPKLRPVATVRFAWAEMHIAGLRERKFLVDATGVKPGAIHYV